MPQRVYLDWNATAPIRDTVRNEIAKALDTVGNPSSIHLEGRKARTIIENARQQVASLCGVDPDRIVFTSGATEAAALVLADKNLLSSAIEHPSILAWTKSQLSIDEEGKIEVDNPEQSTVQIANSETGLMQNIPKGIKVSDATQALGKVPVKDIICRADYVIVSAHKMGGPKGIGAVILGHGIEINSQLKGGGQEFNRRSGTENIYGIAGFGAAACEAEQELSSGRWEEVNSLRNKFEEMLKDTSENITIFSENRPRLPNTSCFSAPGWKGVTQVMKMDMNGFAVSAGSACSSGKIRSSETLDAFGAAPVEANSAIRVSIGPLTTLEEISRFVQVWHKEYKQICLMHSGKKIK